MDEIKSTFILPVPVKGAMCTRGKLDSLELLILKKGAVGRGRRGRVSRFK
jgi:hypothetical protein